MNSLLLAFAVSAAGAWLSGFVVYRVLHRCRVFDVPNARSSHQETVVRGGGIAILLTLVAVGGWVFSAGEWAPSPALLVGLGLLATVSFIDDLRGLSYGIRLAIHLLGAALALWGIGAWQWWAGALCTAPEGPACLAMTGAVFAAAVVAVVGYTNAFNFMDGVNGLAAGQAVVSCLAGVVFCLLSSLPEAEATAGLQVPGGPAGGWLLILAILGGASAGFLPHNFPSARMFLGDVGSVTIGFLIAVIVIAVLEFFGWKAALALACMQLNFLGDTMITLIRRWRRGERIQQAHREHFYQRLNRSGKDHRQVTGAEMVLQLVCGLLLAAGFFAPGPFFCLGPLAAMIVWLLFFRYCEKRFVVSAAGQ